jgi:transcription antitermination factor NusB
MRKRTKARECTLQALYIIDIASKSAAEALSDFWEDHPDATQEVQEFTKELLEGTYQHRDEIDATISRYATNWTLQRMAIVDRNILRFATYELLFRSDIPPKVTINEAVDIAKKFGDANSGKFVNGILDKIGKESKRIEKG